MDSALPTKLRAKWDGVSYDVNVNFVPLQWLLLLSSLPLWRSKTRLTSWLEMADEHVEQVGSRWRYKSRTSQLGLLDSASPRNARRSRRLLEMEVRKEKELGLVEGIGKPGKRHHIARSKKEKVSLISSVPSSNLSPIKS
ncbi:hypothetical protein TorRG33x02_200360 [Trema orientale]|uniref:Uncharacterized protein n=1 Tax=Trema orientale TaxID=63057 RepID=A0A2P5EF41_TREOI|nr:hypothetical protein TorRG33x02_200360 [Trema orientale]